ncbi:DUF4190 domain-containing protein [Pseudarthrobacter sp. N5]|uniref:DUF4190 domain-containing protein n=1 Tax=Pseudarthrobacter sp. N5 TaxID=3418416 RepID=UPI003CEEB1DE
MTEQPTPLQDGRGDDETPAGYQPPQFVPPQGADIPAPPLYTQPGEPQPEQPYVQPGEQHAGQYGQPPSPYAQPPSPYAQPPSQYGQPPSPYGQPPSQYGQPPSQYGQPPSPYGQPPSPYGQPNQYAQPGNPYGQPAYYGMPVEPKGLSIASMCCGIAIFVGFGFFILPQIAAVILGHIGLKKEPAGRGFAIAGLVMGYIGIALTVLAFVVFGIFLNSTSNFYRDY